MRFMLRRQAGTTLIEPLVATTVVGALAAAVLPQFAALGNTAHATRLQGVAAAATSAMRAMHAMHAMHAYHGVGRADHLKCSVRNWWRPPSPSPKGGGLV